MLAGMKQVQLRLPDDLAQRIDARAAKVGLSRHAWIVKALTWAEQQPIRTVRTEEKL